MALLEPAAAAVEVPRLAPAFDVEALNAAHGDLSASEAMALAIHDLFPGRIALVSSFGAESAVLLHLVATIDRALPVIFLDTGRLFVETLQYRTQLTELLGLTDVRTIQEALPTLISHQGNTNYAWVCAGTILSIAPVFHMYVVLNRRMEDALVAGALKR